MYLTLVCLMPEFLIANYPIPFYLGGASILISNGFDKFGNYTFGVKEHIIFPEVSFDRADKVRGIDIIIVISSKSKEHSFALLEKLNFPFIKKGDN